MKLALVVPRYGQQVKGGAENAARELATRLATTPDWEVEVLTTTAVDSVTWAEALPAGTTREEGVVVHRFAIESGRHPGFESFSAPLLASAAQASAAEARRWVDMQGPVSPALIDATTSSDADVLAFYPYLYHPTADGLPRVARRAVLHAAAHDEPPILLPVFRPVFARAAGLVYHTRHERELVTRLFPVSGRPQIVLGLGVGRPLPASAAHAHPSSLLPDLGEHPYLLCLGRVDDQKGVGALWRAFQAYKQRRPGPLKLVLAGPVIDRPPPAPDVVVPGPVDEEQKWSLLAGAEALVLASALESFSLVVAESWSAGRPVLVNAACAAAMENVTRSGGGLWFRGYAAFEAAVDRLTAGGGLADHMGERGRQYVKANFDWPVVLDRYRHFVTGVADRAR